MQNQPLPPAFDPSPEQIEQILEALINPHLTLRDIASDHNTNLCYLAEFLARPDIAQRVDDMEAAVARRARLIATAHLPAVAHMLTSQVDEHNDEAANIPIKPGSTQALEQRRRSRETARRAIDLLARLAKFTPGSSSPRGTGVPPVRSSPRRPTLPTTPTAHTDAHPLTHEIADSSPLNPFAPAEPRPDAAPHTNRFFFLTELPTPPKSIPPTPSSATQRPPLPTPFTEIDPQSLHSFLASITSRILPPKNDNNANDNRADNGRIHPS